MGALTLLKRYWNILMAFALAFVTLMSEVLISPKIDISTSLASVNISTLSRVIITALTLFLIYPLTLYNKRKFMRRWWIAAAVFLVLSLLLFIHYQSVYYNHTATDRLKEETFVVGNTLLPSARPVYDSLIKINRSRQAVNSMLLEGYADDPTDIWLPEEVQHNTMAILGYYLAALVSFYLCALCAAQAIYCLRREIKQ